MDITPSNNNNISVLVMLTYYGNFNISTRLHQYELSSGIGNQKQ